MRGIPVKLAAALLLLSACTQDPSIGSSNSAVTNVGSPASYPNGPYGFGVGNTIPNLEFLGKPGSASGQTDLSLRPISLADYQRHGTVKTKALVIIACAAWCEPCQREQWALNWVWEQYQQTHPGEVVFVTAMVQDGSFHAATERSIDNWSRDFEVPYDLVVDPTASVMQRMDANEVSEFPTTIVVRTRNMRITERSLGLHDFRPAVDAILANANDPSSPPPVAPGTIYPGPVPQPDCRLAGACTEPQPQVTCPDGQLAPVRCDEQDDTSCGWTVLPCAIPQPTGVCPDADCGAKPDLPPDLCGEGGQLTLTCLKFSNGSCGWGGSCGGGPPPPPPSDCSAPGACGPPPPPSTCGDGTTSTYACQPSPKGTCMWTSDCAVPPPVDCSLAGACGPNPAPSTCPDGSEPIVQCLDLDGSCQWMEPCPPPPPPPVDCSPAGSCPGPVPTDNCLDPGMITTHVCEDVGGHCDWGLMCSGGTK
jgi:hypothetical protein